MWRLVHQEARRRAVQAVLDAQEGFVVTIKPPTRNLEQNAKLHALLGELSAQVPYGGKMRSIDTWKAILVSAHAIATNEPTEIVAGLEGEFFNLREATSKMSVARMSSLIEYAVAYCAMNNVKTDQL